MKPPCTVVALIVVGFACGAALADGLVNGDFEAVPAMTGWTVDGVVQVIELPGDGNRVALIQENPTGAFSRFYQEFELPADPACLSFRFVLLANPFRCPQGVATGGTAPPDAFLVFLTTTDTFERLVVPPECEPTFTEAFFWMDNDDSTPPQYCDELGLVGAAPISAEDFSTVALDISSLAGGQLVRVEFGMADGCDGQNTQIVVDDVLIETADSGSPTNCDALGPPVPATSTAGLLILALLLIVAGAAIVRRGAGVRSVSNR